MGIRDCAGSLSAVKALVQYYSEEELEVDLACIRFGKCIAFPLIITLDRH